MPRVFRVNQSPVPELAETFKSQEAVPRSLMEFKEPCFWLWLYGLFC